MSLKEAKEREKASELAREKEQQAKEKEAAYAATKVRQVDPAIGTAFTRQAIKAAKAKNEMKHRLNEVRMTVVCMCLLLDGSPAKPKQQGWVHV